MNNNNQNANATAPTATPQAAATAQTATVDPLTKALSKYLIKNGPAQGLIDEVDIDNCLVDCLEALMQKYVRQVEDVDQIKVNDEVRDAFAALLKTLSDKVFVGLATVKGKGQGRPKTQLVTKSPRHGINYTDTIYKAALPRFLAHYAPKTPALSHEPDARRYLEICADLFPNVMTAHKAANALRDFIENVHNSCHTNGATFAQKALWLFSYKVGGTGKSYFLDCLKEACNRLGIDAAFDTFHGGEWVAPSIGLHTVTISEDTPKLTAESAELMNNLIDRSIFRYNQKWGATGNAKSFANLVLASNYESFESNTRRYNVVEYLQLNVEAALSAEEIDTYFPLWGDRERMIERIVEAFRVCPFRSEHTDWRSIARPNSNGTQTPQKIAVGTKFHAVLADIQETIAKVESDSDLAYMRKTPELTHSRPTAFAKAVSTVLGKSAYEKEAFTNGVINFLTELRSQGHLGAKEAKTPIRTLRVDWYTFDRFSVGEVSDEAASNPLEDTRDQWERLITDESFTCPF